MARLEMRKVALPAVLALLPIGAAAAGERETLPGPVSYEVRSWGRILLRWQINPDGSGEIWRLAEHKDSAQIRKFRLRLDGNAWQAFVTNAEDARVATANGVACRKDIYDLPYGSITWDYPGARREYRFDAGCRSEKADQIVDMLAAADTVVETLAKIEPDPYIVEPAGNR